ncbi:MAG: hypothetical protein IIV74_03200 [Alphaproteobacteria bacterium]|nr:hypothetical protein [Alphaproteobacteria bacterium]
MKKFFLFLMLVIWPFRVGAVDLPQILTDVDASLYEQVFVLQDKEKFSTAINVESQIADKLLMGEVLYQVLATTTISQPGWKRASFRR